MAADAAPDLLRRLYGQVAAPWVARGLNAHFASAPAGTPWSEEWADLEFGRLVALGVRATAQAATPDLVPDLAPYLTEHNEVQPDPAPTAPPVESSFTAFDSTDPINALRDLTPAGVPATGLVDSLGDVPKKITPSAGGGGTGAGYE